MTSFVQNFDCSTTSCLVDVGVQLAAARVYLRTCAVVFVFCHFYDYAHSTALQTAGPGAGGLKKTMQRLQLARVNAPIVEEIMQFFFKKSFLANLILLVIQLTAKTKILKKLVWELSYGYLKLVSLRG